MASRTISTSVIKTSSYEATKNLTISKANDMLGKLDEHVKNGCSHCIDLLTENNASPSCKGPSNIADADSSGVKVENLHGKITQHIL